MTIKFQILPKFINCIINLDLKQSFLTFTVTKRNWEKWNVHQLFLWKIKLLFGLKLSREPEVQVTKLVASKPYSVKASVLSY